MSKEKLGISEIKVYDHESKGFVGYTQNDLFASRRFNILSKCAELSLFGIIIMNFNLPKLKEILNFTKELLKRNNKKYLVFVMSELKRQNGRRETQKFRGNRSLCHHLLSFFQQHRLSRIQGNLHRESNRAVHRLQFGKVGRHEPNRPTQYPLLPRTPGGQ